VSSATGSGRWLFCRTARPNPRLRLFCVPFAGTGASAFNAWSSAFPDTVELHAVQLPGRESRYHEPALSDAYEAARLLADAIEPYLDRCYVFFGHSMGALIAFEAIRELRRRHAPMPAQLFVGARRAPQLAAMRPPLTHVPREVFLRLVSDYYDSPPAAWQNPDLLEIVLPVLRADMALCEGYVYRREPPFDFPIQAFAGLRDRSAPLSAVQAWREQTTGEFAVEGFDGGHFFVNASLARLQQVMLLRLEHLMLGAASS
jgi:medium-chain acyl-[acyl-carrier-protein] hydrolase